MRTINFYIVVTLFLISYILILKVMMPLLLPSR